MDKNTFTGLFLIMVIIAGAMYFLKPSEADLKKEREVQHQDSLKKAGFPHDLALCIMMDKDSYPEWVPYRTINGIDSDDEDDDGIDLL
mgnify:CR=1 FL=1